MTFCGRTPKTLALLITRKCNLECEICYVFNNSAEESLCKDLEDEVFNNDLSYDEITELIEQAQLSGYNSLHIYGGEPFTRPDLKRIVEFAYKLDFNISIATNMLLITDNDYEWIGENKVALAVSINYWDLQSEELSKLLISKKKTEILNNYNIKDDKKVEYNKSPIVFKQKMEIINNLIKNKINFTVITVITKENYLTYEDFIDFMLRKGVSSFWVNYFSLLGRGKNLKEISLDGYEWNKFISQLEQNNQYKETPIRRANLHVEASYISEDNFIPFNTDCYLLDEMKVMVNNNGDVYPCILFVNKPEWLLGNVRKEELKSILKRLNKKWISERFKTPEKCNSCIHLDVCQGGCPAYYLDFSGDYRCKKISKLYLTCPLMNLF